MKLGKIIEQLGLHPLNKVKDPDREITHAYTGDLLSDVMANSSEGDLWITLQTHMNIIAVASLKNLSGIVIVNNRRPEGDVIKKADEEGVTLLSSPMSAFEVSGRLYAMLSEG
jgi:hypothetical protein